MVKENLRVVYNTTKEAGKSIVEGAKSNPEPFKIIGTYFIIPFCILIILFTAFIYQKQIKEYLIKKFANLGYVKIWIRQNNREIKKTLKKIDRFGMFDFNKGKYNLYDLEKYIFCYENGVPVVLFFEGHTLPVIVNTRQPDEQMKEDLEKIYNVENYDGDEKKKLMDNISQELNELKLQTNPKIVKSVFDNKLIQDLYSVSGGNQIDRKILFIVLGAIVLIFLAITGKLMPLLEYLGVK